MADAAERTANAGFDLIEVHGHTGYLIDQFLSSTTNKRTMAMEGSLEKETFPYCRELLNAIRKRRWAANIAVTFRIECC